jgi:sec-independent protein translocase protein TatA
MPFGFGHWWIIIGILLIVLIIYGPGKLPEVGSGFGKAIREFRKASTELTDEIKREAAAKSGDTPTSTSTQIPPPPPTPIPPPAQPKAEPPAAGDKKL